jgi:hypothetical protein
MTGMVDPPTYPAPIQRIFFIGCFLFDEYSCIHCNKIVAHLLCQVSSQARGNITETTIDSLKAKNRLGIIPAATYIPFNVDLKLLGGSSNHTRKPLKD